MKNDRTILPFRQSETVVDPLTELARQGARRMLAEALKAEADAFLPALLMNDWTMAVSVLCGMDLARNAELRA